MHKEHDEKNVTSTNQPYADEKENNPIDLANEFASEFADQKDDNPIDLANEFDSDPLPFCPATPESVLAFAPATMAKCGVNLGYCSPGNCCSRYDYCGHTEEVCIYFQFLFFFFFFFFLNCIIFTLI